MTVWIFASLQQRDQKLALLKCSPCPHCKHVGALNRHGFLKGYDEHNFKQKAVRALRVFCSNRRGSGGCGRTFSIWIADKVKRLFLDAKDLWRFLEQAGENGNRAQAFKKLACSLSDSAPYRIWKRFLQAQSAIRTTLVTLCSPPKPQHSHHYRCAATATLAHLQEAFKDSTLNPIAAYQVQSQSFFI